MGLREDKKLDTWRTLRRVALELFEERGYDNVGVEEIAATARVSRATFFNYFSRKEGVIFDRDPDDRRIWLASMAARPTDEDVWDSLVAVLVEYNERNRQALALQRRLKAETPALAASTKELGQQFRSDLHQWMVDRVGPGQSELATLHVNLAFAAAATAYQLWQIDEPVDVFFARLQYCLDRVRNGVLTALTPQPAGEAQVQEG